MIQKTLDKKQAQVREQIVYNFIQILSNFAQYTIGQHLAHIIRRKGEGKELYYLTDEELLKKFEKYYDELNEELVATKELSETA